MKRALSLAVVCLMLTGSGIAYANYVGPSKNGFSFHASVFPEWLYLPTDRVDSDNSYPSSTTIRVRVRDIDQQLANGVPVTFRVDSRWQGHVTIKPTRAITHNGVAEAPVTTKDKIGFCRIAVQVDDLAKYLTLNIDERGPGSGGPMAPGLN
jgi:hypothetical protein